MLITCLENLLCKFNRQLSFFLIDNLIRFCLNVGCVVAQSLQLVHRAEEVVGKRYLSTQRLQTLVQIFPHCVGIIT